MRVGKNNPHIGLIKGGNFNPTTIDRLNKSISNKMMMKLAYKCHKSILSLAGNPNIRGDTPNFRGIHLILVVPTNKSKTLDPNSPQPPPPLPLPPHHHHQTLLVLFIDNLKLGVGSLCDYR